MGMNLRRLHCSIDLAEHKRGVNLFCRCCEKKGFFIFRTLEALPSPPELNLIRARSFSFCLLYSSNMIRPTNRKRVQRRKSHLSDVSRHDVRRIDDSEEALKNELARMEATDSQWTCLLYTSDAADE